MERANDSSLSGNDKYEGYCADLAKMIAEHVGFSYEIKLVNDSKYGTKDENNEWNGIVGELVREVSSTIILVEPIFVACNKPFSFSSC